MRKSDPDVVVIRVVTGDDCSGGRGSALCRGSKEKVAVYTPLLSVQEVG